VSEPDAALRRKDLRLLVKAHRDNDPQGVEATMTRLVPDPDDVTAWRSVAVTLMNFSLLAPAIETQLKCVNAGVRLKNRQANDENLLVAMILMRGDPRGAVRIARRVTRHWPDYVPGWENLAYALTQTGETAEAAEAYRNVLAAKPEHLNAMDGLGRCLGTLGEHEEAVALGRSSLALKDEATRDLPVLWDIPDTLGLSDSNPSPKTHIIAYSLWGEDARYIDTLTRNVRLARELYPNWSCRIYHDDTVPADALSALQTGGAELIAVNDRHVAKEGLLWRFLVAGDPQVKRYLVRDADSLLTVRERVAVDDWLASGKPFHLMRDWYSHTDLMLAGMWGAVGGRLTGIKSLMEAHVAGVSVPNRQIDQQFLASTVWPSTRNHTLIHDDLFGVLGALPFPPFGRLPKRQHVGMNVSATSPKTRMITPRLTTRKPAGKSA
jgi:tetratricopeptide (TPR) repeat protein